MFVVFSHKTFLSFNVSSLSFKEEGHDQKRPLAAADRAADRAGVSAQPSAETKPKDATPIFVFVERKGPASAATVASGIKLRIAD